jgi:hypothetical protein
MQKFIVCAVTRDGASIHAFTNLADILPRWRAGGIDAVPVAVFYGDVNDFKMESGIRRLPTTIPLIRAAALFHNVGIDVSVQAVVGQHIRRLGAVVAPVLMEWQRAIVSAKEVAA